MAGEIPLIKGKDSKFIFLFEESKQLIDAIDWEIGAVGEDIEDDICGEDRTRLDYVASHYTLTINAKMQDAKLLDAFIKSQKARDARSIPKSSSVAILLYLNNGTRASYQCRDYVLGQWKMSVGGRKERNKVSIPGRFRYFDTLPGL